jgi:2-methylcitrate dehydratase PrpD
MSSAPAASREDASMVLARHVAESDYTSISEEARTTARRSIVDSLGVMIGATGAVPSLDQLVRAMRNIGPAEKGDATVVGFGGTAMPLVAAFLNGASSHSLDYDDTHETRLCHPSAPLLSAGLACAESIGNVTGKEFIAAIALGQDVYCRLAGAAPTGVRKLHGALTWGGIPVAATCSKLLKLDEASTYDAFAIVGCRSGGPAQLSVSEGSDFRGIYNAFIARDGLEATLMAKEGIKGISGLLEGRCGLIAAYFNGVCDRQAMLGGLGEEFPCTEVSYKPWPSCRITHGYIDATLSILEENDLVASDVDAITVYLGDFASTLFEPIDDRMRPKTVLDAKISLPFTVGVAVARGAVRMADFEPEALDNPDVLEMAAKVESTYDSRFDARPAVGPPSMVEIRTRGGSKISKFVEFAKGHPSNPMTWDDLIGKLREGLGYSAVPVASTTVDEMVSRAEDLDSLRDIGEWLRLAWPHA